MKKSRPLSTFHCGHVGCGSRNKECFTPSFATKRVLHRKQESLQSISAEKTSGVFKVDAVKPNSTMKSETVESALSIHTSDDESLPSDSDSESVITVLNSPAVKIIDPSIDKTKRLDLMQEKWSKFCQSETQLQEIFRYNTFEIVEIIGIFVVIKPEVVFYEDFSTEVSIDELNKCSEPSNGSFFGNSTARGLELVNITEFENTFILEMASRWEPSKTFQCLDELKKYLEAEKMELYFAENKFKNYNIPRFVLINPFTKFKPDDAMMEIIKVVLPVTLDKKNLPLWRANRFPTEVSFAVQEFNDIPIACNFIASLDIFPVTENPAISIQYCLAIDEIYLTNRLAVKPSPELITLAELMLVWDAAIEYERVSGMRNHLQGRVHQVFEEFRGVNITVSELEFHDVSLDTVCSTVMLSYMYGP